MDLFARRERSPLWLFPFGLNASKHALYKVVSPRRQGFLRDRHQGGDGLFLNLDGPAAKDLCGVQCGLCVGVIRSQFGIALRKR